MDFWLHTADIGCILIIFSGMLYPITLSFEFVAFSLSLWLGFYLLGRGFTSQVTLRAVAVLLALAAFFLDAVYNIFHQLPGSAAWRAVFLVSGLTIWYSLTVRLLPRSLQERRKPINYGMYTLAVCVVINLLFSRSAFRSEIGNDLWVAHMGFDLPFILYGAFQILVITGILYNLLTGPRLGLNTRGRYFLISSSLPALGVAYGAVSLVLPGSMPRIIQDGLVFAGVFMMGISVARHQTLVERRTTLQDFPVSALVLLGLSSAYALIAWQFGYPPEQIALFLAFAILTHSLYDLAREVLERQRYRADSTFRHHLRQLEILEQNPDAIQHSLQDILDLLCQMIDASCGWVAVRADGRLKIAASKRSLAVGLFIPMPQVTTEDLFQPEQSELAGAVWAAPAMAGSSLVVLLAVGEPQKTLNYSTDDLDLLAETADRLAAIVALAGQIPEKQNQIEQIASEIQEESGGLRENTDALLTDLTEVLIPGQVEMVEDALRQFHDYIFLGQSPLAAWLGIPGENHIERGRNLNEYLSKAIELLHPPGERPRGVLPRSWFNYVVLHDAYVDCEPNREIMARLYISEGTFNRTRRNALRGLTRVMLEHKHRGKFAGSG